MKNDKFVVMGHIFRTIKRKSGEGIVLSYYGKEKGIPQGCIWICDDEKEADSMIEAVIDPERYPDDEYKERHKEEMMNLCKW